MMCGNQRGFETCGEKGGMEEGKGNGTERQLTHAPIYIWFARMHYY